VLALASRGMSNSQIAGALGLATRTVSKHLERCFDKLGPRERAAAAAEAARRGEI
jgi:DNA-binding NarL/FixJ family response regulator